MRQYLVWIFCAGVVLCAPPAQALYFGGGTGDGYGYALGDSRSWGFFGGPGRGEVMTLTAAQTLMTFTSAAVQTFTMGDPSTAASTLTIRQDTAIGAGVLAAKGLRVIIPAALDMTWNTAKTALTVTGSAAGKVSASAPALTVTYPDNKTMLISVLADFVDTDTIVVAGMEFNNFTFIGTDYLELDISGAGSLYEFDPFQKMILAPERSRGFLGGAGRGENELDIYQLPRNALDLGILF